MIDLSLLTDGGVGWLDASGPSSHLVLSTRIRLARNLAGRVFQGRNSETEREDILQTVEAAARDTVLLRRAIKFRLDRLYLRNAGLWLDLKLILISFWITGRGDWEQRHRRL